MADIVLWTLVCIAYLFFYIIWSMFDKLKIQNKDLFEIVQKLCTHEKVRELDCVEKSELKKKSRWIWENYQFKCELCKKNCTKADIHDKTEIETLLSVKKTKKEFFN